MNAGETEVREAALGDTDGVLDAYEWLFASPGSPPPEWDRDVATERLHAAMESESAAVLVAVRDDAVVGICTAYIDLLSVRYGVRCWVEDLAVDPAARSGGIGRDLLTRAREWAAAHGASHLELDSGEARVDAHRFYAREGSQNRSFCFGWYGLQGGG